jgi:hypothetical protein
VAEGLQAGRAGARQAEKGPAAGWWRGGRAPIGAAATVRHSCRKRPRGFPRILRGRNGRYLNSVIFVETTAPGTSSEQK